MMKQGDYNKLQNRLVSKAGRKIFPIKAMFELTYRCNLKCRHCYVVLPSEARDGHRSKLEMGTNKDSGQRELSTKEVFVILDELAAAGCLNLGFTGGEPLIRKDIFDILRYAKCKGFNIILLTNGTLITKDNADRLKELGLNKIDISFHSIDEEMFDWFTGFSGTYTRVLNAVKLLRERGIEVYFKTTAMTINKHEILAIRHLAVERFGAHFRWGTTLTPACDGSKENLKFRLSAQEINKVKKQLQRDSEIEFEKLDTLERESRKLKKRKRQERNINHNQLFRCGAGRTELTINPFGEMKLCTDLPFPKYNILEGSFSQGWKILSDYVKNTPPSSSYQCRDCELVQYCNFCPGRNWLEGGDMSACPAYYKEMASLEKREAETQDIEVRIETKG